MEVTRANNADLEEIVQLNKLFHLDFSWFKWDSPPWIENTIRDDNYYVIRDDHEVVSAMCLKMLEGEGYIETIAVHRDKQGFGLGRRLIEFAKDYSKKHGKSKLSVESFCDYGIKEFYEKCDFAMASELGNFNGQPYYCFSMDI